MAAVQAFEQGPTPTPWVKPDGCKEMEAAVPVDPSQAWENARKALEKVQTTNAKTGTGADQQAPAGYGAGFGYGFWPGQHPQQGCMYPGYMGYNGYPTQGPGGSGYGFYPHFNMYGGGYYPSSTPMQYPQPGPAGAGNNSAPAGPPLPSGHAPPPPPPGEQAPPPSEKDGGASEAPSAGSGTPAQAQHQQQQQQPPPGFGQQGPAPGFGPGYGSGFCPQGPGYGFYYGYNGMGPNGEGPGPRGPMQFSTGMQGKQAPGAGGVRFSLPKRGKFGGRGGGSRANAFQQQQRAAQGSQRSAADATQRLEDCMANLAPHSGDWPESLKRYAMRAFGKCKSEIDRDQVEIVLKGKLTKMYCDGAMWSIDWDKEPLPSIHSERLQQEQQKVASTAGAATSQDSNSGSSSSGSKVGGGLLPGPASGSPPSKLLSPAKAGGGGGLGRRLGGMTGRLGQPLPPAGGLSGKLSSSGQLGGSGGGDSPPDYIPLKSSSSSSNRRGGSDWGRGSSRRSPRSRSRSRSWSPRSRSPTASHSTQRDRRKKRRSSSLESSSSPEPPRSSKKVLNSSVSSYTHGVNSSNSSAGKNKKSGQANRKANKKQKKQQQQQQMVQFQVEADMATTEKLQKRAARFQSEISAGKKKRPFSLVLSINAGPTLGPSSAIGDGDTDLDWESFPIVGTCQDLEKQYLRLTSAPDPSTIRPVAVLRESLDMVKEHWVLKQDYHYACDQLKSIRQDLTVQCVRDTFTVQVYETHARIALEKGDHEEFNQCQTQLKTLYQEVQCGNPLEFLGYRILYNVFARNTLELKTILAHLSTQEKSDEVVKHALAVCHAWSLGNYARFFKLYERPPKMSGYLMDWFVLRERRNALKAMVKAYRPVLPVGYIERALGFADREDVLAFLAELNVTLAEDGASVDCKESLAAVLAA
ncbi:uncharacterized protein LOC144101411 isoform X2 [Amblyomma americanum]